MELTKCEISELLDMIQEEEDILARIVKESEAKTKKMREELRFRMTSIKQKELAGKLAIATIKQVKKAAVSDWDGVMKYVKDHDAFDILQRRISPAAAQARVDAGEVIDGLTIVPGDELMITKIKPKGTTPRKDLL